MKVEKIVKTTQTEELNIIGATLLSEEEYKRYKDLIPLHNFFWWLRSPSFPFDLDTFASGVYNNGYTYIREVDKYGDVRPALKISNLKSSNLKVGDVFVFAGHQFTVISEDYAQCHNNVGICPFRKNWKNPDANDYKTSDAKRLVENWAKEHGIITQVEGEEV